MNREQKIKLLVVQGMIHRIDIADDIHKIRSFGKGKGSLVSKAISLYSSLSRGNPLLLLSPILKSISGQGKVSRYVRRFCIALGAGALLSRAITYLKSKSSESANTPR